MVKEVAIETPVQAKPQEPDGRNLRRQASRKALLKAARKVFLAQGYGATTVDAITRQAGVAHGTFYSHFGGKEDVFIHVLDKMTEDSYANLERDPYTPTTLSDLHSIVKKQLLQSFRLAVKWQPLMRVLHQAMGESPTIRTYWEDGARERVLRRVEEDIRYSQAHGLYRSLDARLVAEGIVVLTGHFTWQLVLGKESPDRIEHIAETVTNLYLHGVYKGSETAT